MYLSPMSRHRVYCQRLHRFRLKNLNVQYLQDLGPALSPNLYNSSAHVYDFLAGYTIQWYKIKSELAKVKCEGSSGCIVKTYVEDQNRHT